MKKRTQRILSLFMAVLTLCLTVTPALAADDTTAAAMQLMKTEGTVSITNASDRKLTVRDNMRLYNGYSAETKAGSYAWINLDDTKLTKMDASSKVDVRKHGKKLELLVSKGNLYFNVTSPLAEDETLNIRTSTMAVGIRGTAGWAKAIDDHTTEFYVLEGKVECAVADLKTGETQTVTLNAGEKATFKMDPTKEQGARCDIARERFAANDIDSFVLLELAQDPDLWATILERSGLDVREAGSVAETNWNGHAYRIYDVSITWEEARVYCENYGGHLATITSQEEQAVINSLLDDNCSKNGYWLGGIRSNNNFIWITGEQMNYTNWASSQPDNDHGTEDKVMLYNYAGSRLGKWNDLSNEGELDVVVANGTLGFICEWDR